MPTAWVTLSEELDDLDYGASQSLRDILAKYLSCRARCLDRNHIVLRCLKGSRTSMLADIEIEVSAQFYFSRHFNRDSRTEAISRSVSKLLGISCATWIKLTIVGYARVTSDGVSYFSN